MYFLKFLQLYFMCFILNFIKSFPKGDQLKCTLRESISNTCLGIDEKLNNHMHYLDLLWLHIAGCSEG